MTEDIVIEQLKLIGQILAVNDGIIDEVISTCHNKIFELAEYCKQKGYRNEVTLSLIAEYIF